MNRPNFRQTALAAALIAGLGMTAQPATASRNDAEAIARAYLQKSQQRFGLNGGDIRETTVSSIVPGTAPGLSHVYLQQNYRGIPVWNGITTINVLGDGSVLNPGNRFIGNLAAQAGSQMARKTSVQAAQAAAGFLELRVKEPVRALSRKGGPTQAMRLSTGGFASKPIDAELVWFFAEDMNQLRLAWRLQIDEIGGRHAWNAFVDAGTGEPLAAKDRIVHDNAASIAAATSHAPASLIAASGVLAPTSPVVAAPFPNIDGATYAVYPQPYESPADGGAVIVSGAASPTASPYGWHDTNGAPGPEFNLTHGNNVHAYSDADANDIADPGSEADGGPLLSFNFPRIDGQSPLLYRDAAITNLFYWNNIVHDITYNYGFNEASGNFQSNNYGKGGLGLDYVQAEAQDGSGTNNANFSTPPDGDPPRMQMYQWTFPFPNAVAIDAPSPIAGNYIASTAAFGPSMAAAGPQAAALVLANDGVGTTGDACEALVGFPAGAIALFDRGTCTFVIKVKNAQNAGAIAAVAINNAAGNPIAMGGTDATITIPSVMVSLADGNLFKANLPANAIAQANPTPPSSRDSDFDAGVIAHEYGHGISNRLTGGPATTSCLDNGEQMGEGWSDWFAATLTSRPTDTPTTLRGTATYLSFEGINGTGIRPTPYTTNMAVNTSTYASVANTTTISSPHGIGYVWNSMLWEVYWNLVNRYGYNPDMYGSWTTGGNNRAFQLVMDGMKFQSCRPGFVDGRNGILAADTALTGGANKCEIWRGFAKRGLGFSATQGNTNNRGDGVQAFDLPAACTAAVFGGFQAPVVAAPAINTITVGQTVSVKFSLTGVAAPVLIDTQPVSCSSLLPTGEAPIALNSSLGLVQSGNDFQIDWKTGKNWANTCRAVTLRIPAASDPVAYFRIQPLVPDKVKANR